MGDLKKSYGSRYESIIFSSEKDFRFNGKRPQDIIRVCRVSPQKLLHPNEKPIELLEKLINQCTDKKALVLDPFMGSGSTGVAAMQSGRNFIGMEKENKYFMTAKVRIDERVCKEVLWEQRVA